MADVTPSRTVVVTGLPGAGKTTLIEHLGRHGTTGQRGSLTASDMEEAPPHDYPRAEHALSTRRWMTVVDASRFEEECAEAALLSERGLPGPQGWTVADLLLEQVERAHTVVMNKCDLLEEGRVRRLAALMARLNPTADIVCTAMGRPLDELPRRARSPRPSWDPHFLEHDAVSAFTFRAHAPFDAHRLFACIMQGWRGVVRSRGHFYVGTQRDEQLSWCTAGAAFRFEHVGRWRAARGQDLHFIGHGMDQHAIEADLIAALEGPHAMPLGIELADPFMRPLRPDVVQRRA